MEKAEQHIQSEYIHNAYILINCNDIRNADMNELQATLNNIPINNSYIRQIKIKNHGRTN